MAFNSLSSDSRLSQLPLGVITLETVEKAGILRMATGPVAGSSILELLHNRRRENATISERGKWRGTMTHYSLYELKCEGIVE